MKEPPVCWSSFSFFVCWWNIDVLGDLGSHMWKMAEPPSACVLENVLYIQLK